MVKNQMDSLKKTFIGLCVATMGLCLTFPLHAQFKSAKERQQAQITNSSDVQVGVASAVHGNVILTHQGQDQILKSGGPVFLNDFIKTGTEGSVVLLLKDQSTFSLGHNSQFSVDEFVYQPEQPSASKLGTHLITGFARYVSGAVSKANQGGVRMRTPVATIGIRGSVVSAAVTDEANPQLTVTNRGAQRGNPGGANESRAEVFDDSGQVSDVPPGKVGVFQTQTPGVFALVSLSDIPAFSSVFVSTNGNIVLGQVGGRNLGSGAQLSEFILDPSQLSILQNLGTVSQTQIDIQGDEGANVEAQLTHLFGKTGIELQELLTKTPEHESEPEYESELEYE